MARDARADAVRQVGPARVDVARVAAGSSGDVGTWRLTLTHGAGPTALGLRIEDGRPAEANGWAVPDDDGFDLLPGESRTVDVTWFAAPDEGRRLRVSGWNVAPVAVG